ncbi:MAG: Gfo/Idh/MocA family oxidoreductase, partial [Gemmatimonadota bacterium]|nr:Gfo/Idh/MocA family oxidoreductase [Gemmatimonadota bacterium]
MLKCAIIGVSGGRARGLAEAYQHITHGKLAAISTRTEENLHAFGDTFDVNTRYLDYREMFEKEQPDLVHVNTPPSVRLEVFEAAENAGVPAVLVEKPIAIQGEDWRAIKNFTTTAKTKIAVNHQLHFHPRRQHLQNIVQEGKIGDIRFIEASCGMNLAYQGTHALQAIAAFHPDGLPIKVMGQASGTDFLVVRRKPRFARYYCIVAIEYADGLRAQLISGPFA